MTRPMFVRSWQLPLIIKSIVKVQGLAMIGELYWIFGQGTRIFPSVSAAMKDPENQAVTR